MRNLDFGPGCHIKNAAEMLVAAAIEHGEARGFFNEIELRATASDTPDQIVAKWDRDFEARAEAYRKSPAGIKAAQESEHRRRAAQAKHDEMIAKLPSLDMMDREAVLDWLCAFQEPSDHVGVIVKRDTVVSHFESFGYKANANCGDDYDGNHIGNSYIYLVGQALAGLKDGPAIHPILHKFTAEWKARFAKRH